MKNFKILSIDSLIIILISVCLGVFIGRMFPSLHIKLEIFQNKLYLKCHPESQLGTKNIILKRATSNCKNVPQKDIFEDTGKKDNKIIVLIKKIIPSKNKTNEQTIYSYSNE